jgi:hypothetical protein
MSEQTPNPNGSERRRVKGARERVTFDEATRGLSRQLSDKVYQHVSRFGLQENDPFWAVLWANAELLQVFLEQQESRSKETDARLDALDARSGQVDKRLEQLIATAREAALSRREQHEQMRADEQKAREKERQDAQAGFAAFREEMAKATRLNLITLGASIGLTAALCLGGMAWWHSSAEKDEQAQRDTAAQAYEQSEEGMWWHNLRATKAGLHFTLGDDDSNGVSRRLVLTVSPGKEPASWKLQAANLDAGGNAVLTFHKPEPGAAEAAAAAARHR